QLTALKQGTCERLLTVDVLASADGCQRGNGMDVVRCADRHGVDVLRLLVEHHAKVLVAPRSREGPIGASGPFVIHVAQGDDIGTKPGERGDVAAAHAAGADAGQVDPLTRRDKASPSQHVTWDDGGHGSSGGAGQKGSA